MDRNNVRSDSSCVSSFRYNYYTNDVKLNCEKNTKTKEKTNGEYKNE